MMDRIDRRAGSRRHRRTSADGVSRERPHNKRTDDDKTLVVAALAQSPSGNFMREYRAF